MDERVVSDLPSGPFVMQYLVRHCEDRSRVPPKSLRESILVPTSYCEDEDRVTCLGQKAAHLVRFGPRGDRSNSRDIGAHANRTRRAISGVGCRSPGAPSLRAVICLMAVICLKLQPRRPCCVADPA